MEEFKNINNTGYKVSNLGYVIDPGGNKCTITIDNSGYCSVRINKKKVSLHRIVAKAFLKNYENKSQVNHKNGDKANNCVWNLEWCTPFENQMHRRYVLGKNMDGINNPMYGVCGRKSPVYKDDILQVTKDGTVVNTFVTGIEAANYLGIRTSTIYKCLSSKYKRNITHKGYYWIYKTDYEKMLQADLKPREFMEHLKRDNHDPSLLFKKEGATTIESIDSKESKKLVEQGSSGLEARGLSYKIV